MVNLDTRPYGRLYGRNGEAGCLKIDLEVGDRWRLRHRSNRETVNLDVMSHAWKSWKVDRVLANENL